jgi:hypothetical protein
VTPAELSSQGEEVPWSLFVFFSPLGEQNSMWISSKELTAFIKEIYNVSVLLGCPTVWKLRNFQSKIRAVLAGHCMI